VTWIVVSKLALTSKEGLFEEEEDRADYIAMHVYPNDGEKGSKILKAVNSLVRSTYRSEQTVMLYLQLPNAAEYLNSTKVLNLVLDAIDRKKDLFFNVRIFSTHPFEANRCHS